MNLLRISIFFLGNRNAVTQDVFGRLVFVFGSSNDAV